MPKYKIMGERTLVEAWTYIVEAEDEDQAIEMVEECPDGECDGIIRLQDVSYFGKAGTFKDGSIKYMSSCKKCRKQQYNTTDRQYYIEAAKTRYRNNKEEILERSKIYQQISPKPKKWRENNKEYLHNKAKEWYENNKDKALENQADRSPIRIRLSNS